MPASDIEWAVTDIKTDAEHYKLFDEYYDGDHPMLFATEKFRNAFGALFREFADNLCPAVVDAVADRLRISGWDGSDAGIADELAKELKFERAMRQVFKSATKAGNAYLLVWKSPKTDKVGFWPHNCDQMTVKYDEDDPDTIEVAAKLWITEKEKKARLNLYYEDHIEKYVTPGKCENGVPDKEDKWETFIADVENPHGMPVFHFGNNAEMGDKGESQLKNVVPIQNALNKAVCDMLVAMEFNAYPQRWATGLQIEVDEDTGKPKNPPFTPGVDRIWTAAGEVKFGQFDAAQLDGFLNVQDKFRAEVARVSGTPTHFLNLEATWPTGEAMKVSEGRLVKMLEDRSTIYDDPAANAMKFALKLDGKTTKEPDKLDIVPVWNTFAPHNPLLDAETQLVKQQVGVSQEVSLKELGYEDEEIKAMLAANEEVAQKKADREMAAAQAVAPAGGPNAFNRNGSPGKASKAAPQKQQQDKVPVPKPKAGSGQYQQP